MEAYLILCIVPLLLQPVFPRMKSNPKQKQQYLVLCGLLFIIILGLRSRTVGSTDTNNYYRMMDRAINSGSWEDFYNSLGVESGFQLYVWLLSRVFKNPQWILIISTSVFTFCNLRFISKYSEDAATSVVLFVTLGLMVFEMQAMRQALAMSFCLLAYENIQTKKFVPFIFLIVVASMVHRTAIIFIPVYFLSSLKMKRKSLILFFALATVSLFASTKIIQIANRVFYESYDTTVSRGGFIAVAIYVLIALFAGLFDQELRKDQVKTHMYYMLLLGGVCYIIRYVGALAAERVSFYYMAAQMIVLPNALTRITGREKMVITIAVYILAILLFMYRLGTSNLVPYRFFV